MRNIPDFTCPHGGAQLILEQLPVTGTAYCLVQWVIPGQLSGLLDEVCRFCRMVDARRVLALAELLGDKEKAASYPAAFQVMQMELPQSGISAPDAVLCAVEAHQWRDYISAYNQAMTGVDGARLLSARDQRRLMEEGGCYYVYREETPIGLGQVQGDRLRFLAALIPGAGSQVVAALAGCVSGDTVRLTVADTNQKALRLYRRLGFQETGIAEHWVCLARWGD